MTMMNILTIDKLTIDPMATLGTKYICIGCKPRFVYVNGKKTDAVKGFGYKILCPDKQLMITVAVDGTDQIPDEVLSACPEVAFDGLEIRLFAFGEKPFVSVRADTIRVKKN